MKTILLFLLISISAFSQKKMVLVEGFQEVGEKFYTNEPDLVYSILEEFIAENHLRGTSVLEKLQKLDSVVVSDLGYTITPPFISKVYGKLSRIGINNTIAIDVVLLKDEAKFKKTFYHELGHFFGLEHIEVDKLPLDDPKCFEVMSNRKSPYYNQVLQEAAIENYYKDIHKILMPKTN